MKAFLAFNRGLLGMPTPWKLWLLALVTLNLAIPLGFASRPEAQATVVALFASMAFMTLLTGRFGFTRILGLGHLPWIPLVAYLATRLEQAPADEPFGIWLRAVIALDVVSLLVDTVDVGRYLAGDRAESVEGLS